MINLSFLSTIGNKLDTLAEDTKAQIMPMFTEAADATLGDAQSGAPVLTGELRDSGHIVTTDNGMDWSIEVTFGDGNGYTKYGLYDGYAWFQELGTRFIAPQPYLAPAFDAYAMALDSALKDLF